MANFYTNLILDGKITSFKQYAKQLMNDYGVNVIVEDGIIVGYNPLILNDIYEKKIDQLKQNIKLYESITDEHIITIKKDELENRKKYYENICHQKTIALKAISEVLKDAISWNPPTEKDNEIKELMIKQLHSTIQFDCNIGYYKSVIVEIKNEILTLNAYSIRQQLIFNAKDNIKHLERTIKEEAERVDGLNKWCERFLASLE